MKCFFGLQLPAVHTLADLEMGFPDEFFSEVVYTETRRVLDAVDDDNKLIAWVSTGAIRTPATPCRPTTCSGFWWPHTEPDSSVSSTTPT